MPINNIRVSDRHDYVVLGGTVEIPNGDGTSRFRHVKVTIDAIELWRDLAHKAANSKTGRSVLGSGSIKAVRQGK